MKPPLIPLLLAGVLGGLSCSDGPRRAPISGTVVVGGQPLDRGVINFIPVNGTVGPGAGGPIQNGEYRLEQHVGPILGSNRVEIRGFRKTGRKITVSRTTTDEEIQVVPAAFNAKSKEIVTIQPGPNVANFDVPSIRP